MPSMKDSGVIPDSDVYFIQKLAAAGDQAAYKKIYYYYFQKLCLFAQAIVKVREAAEEIVEDVFIKIWQKKEKLAEIKNLKVYLYTAAKNTSLNYLSSKARTNITRPFDDINIELWKTTSNPEQIMISDEIMSKIHGAVDSLPPRCKMIFKLIREDGLRYKEVSDILNISVHTIDAQMAIAIRKIVTALNPDFDWLASGKPPHDVSRHSIQNP